jgi:serine/threonine protein kinase
VADRVGQQFGNYRLVRPLGRGGFAEVYLGEHIHIQTQVAIKILSTQLVATDLERFIREARTIASLEHRHIVRVFDFGIQEEIPFLVMHYAPNGTLRQHHPKESCVSLDKVLSYMQQIAPALQYAHDRKVIHRDVKPENMLLGSQGEILLSDFGIAVTTATSTSQQTKTTAGTVAYIAPEQIMGKPCLASDQYALGIIVYEWLSGKQPFNGTFFEMCAQHLHAPLPSLRKTNPEISLEVEQCIAKALSKDPEGRFASIQDFATALQETGQQAISALTFTPAQQLSPEKFSDSNTGQDAPVMLKAQSDASPLPNADQNDPNYLKTQPATPTPFYLDLDQPTLLKDGVESIARVMTEPSSVSPVILLPSVLPNQVQRPEKPGHQTKKSLIMVVGLLLLVLLVTISFFYGILPAIASQFLPTAVHPTRQLTPQSTTPTEHPTQPIQRILSSTQAQSSTVKATGQGTVPGTHASGTVCIDNFDTANSITLQTGSTYANTYPSADIHMVLDATVTVPPAPSTTV